MVLVMVVRTGSYQERALPAELCGRVALILEGVGFEPT